MFTVVLLTAVIMIMEEPLSDPKIYLHIILHKINFYITIIFLLEMVIKIIVYGLIANGPRSYLRDGWNIMDSLIVFVSILGMIIEEMTDA